MLSYRLRLSLTSRFLKASGLNFLRISHLPTVKYTCRPSHSSLFDIRNINNDSPSRVLGADLWQALSFQMGKAVICPGVTPREISRGFRNDSINVALLPDSLVCQGSNPNGTFGSNYKILRRNVMDAC